jgi:hypothetical protein
VAAYLQPVAIAAAWLGLVALATAVFFMPRGAEAEPTLGDVVGLGCSMAIAGAAAAIAAFGIGGRKRWAVQLALSVLLVGAIAALLLIYFLWLDPTFARLLMDLWSFQRLQHIAPRWAEQLAGYHGPLGATVGIALGTIAGLLIRFGRRRPRLELRVPALRLSSRLRASVRRHRRALRRYRWPYVGWYSGPRKLDHRLSYSGGREEW